jgi:hypothetical protein
VGRDLSGRVLVHALCGQVDLREVRVVGRDLAEAARAERRGRRSIDSGRGEALVNDRLGDGAPACGRADAGEPVRRNQAGRLEQVGDELVDPVRRDAGAWRMGRLDRGAFLGIRPCTLRVLKIVEFHLDGISAFRAESLRRGIDARGG